ncbi:MAG: hypothetical protein AVDCRST_MAG51-52, partial [uncultured Ramlibacter sp.]
QPAEHAPVGAFAGAGGGRAARRALAGRARRRVQGAAAPAQRSGIASVPHRRSGVRALHAAVRAAGGRRGLHPGPPSRL